MLKKMIIIIIILVGVIVLVGNFFIGDRVQTMDVLEPAPAILLIDNTNLSSDEVVLFTKLAFDKANNSNVSIKAIIFSGPGLVGRQEAFMEVIKGRLEFYYIEIIFTNNSFLPLFRAQLLFEELDSLIGKEKILFFVPSSIPDPNDFIPGLDMSDVNIIILKFGILEKEDTI